MGVACPSELEILENKACVFFGIKASESGQLYDKSLEVFPINTTRTDVLSKINSLKKTYESSGNKIIIDNLDSRILIRLIAEVDHGTSEYMVDLEFSDSNKLSSIRHRTEFYEGKPQSRSQGSRSGS